DHRSRAGVAVPGPVDGTRPGRRAGRRRGRHHRGADLDPLTGPVDRPSPTTSRVGVRGPTGPTRQSPGGTPYCQAPSPAEACAAIPSPTERSLIMHTRPLRRAAVL